MGVWDLSSGFFLSGRTEEWPGGHGGADVVLHRGDHRQARHHRVQRVSTHLSSASSAGSVMGAATIKVGADQAVVILVWYYDRCQPVLGATLAGMAPQGGSKGLAQGC